MKLIICKGRTTENNKDWTRLIYTIETEIAPEFLETERMRLESLIDMWIGTPDTSTPNTLPKTPKKVKVAGKCYDCGKASGQYYRCYECNLKFKGETK